MSGTIRGKIIVNFEKMTDADYLRAPVIPAHFWPNQLPIPPGWVEVDAALVREEEPERRYGRGPFEAAHQMHTLKEIWQDISPDEQKEFLAWTAKHAIQEIERILKR